MSQFVKSEEPATYAVRGEKPLVLESMDVRAALCGMLNEVTLTQHYRNDERQPIEAIYSFALPSDSVMLGLDLQLGDRDFTGVVVKSKEAEEQYEDAIADGDSAVMLQQIAPGLYTLNLANLMPGESASITLRYGQLMRWSAERIRLCIPTTIAPRYGNPRHLEPQQVPESSLSVERSFSFEARILGPLLDSVPTSPSHGIRVERNDGEATVTLTDRSRCMDRDLVLELRQPSSDRTSAYVVQDGDQWLAVASFQPEFGEADTASRTVKVVIDCSGSMAGDSIAQARDALHRVLDELRPQDRFNLVRFGSQHESLFDAPAICSNENLSLARSAARRMDADLGGTEIVKALEYTFRDGQAGDVVLITDGNVWADDSLAARAQASHHRLFTVGVGSAVSEDLVTSLAAATGGHCELVSPGENIVEAVHRQFKRMYFAQADQVTVQWPGEPHITVGDNDPGLFSGDTLHCFAWYRQKPRGNVRLAVRSVDRLVASGETPITTTVTSAGDTNARMAAMQHVNSTDDASKKIALAEQYQLLTADTNLVLVAARDAQDKAETLPAVRKVQHMTAAGWGGMGSLACKVDACLSIDSLMFEERNDFAYVTDSDFNVERSFREESPAPFVDAQSDVVTNIIEALNHRLQDAEAGTDPVESIDLLAEAAALPDDIIAALLELQSIATSEHEVVSMFFTWLLDQPESDALQRVAIRRIRFHLKRNPITERDAHLAATSLNLAASDIDGLDAMA